MNKTIKVLLVEDEAITAILMKKDLERQGFEVPKMLAAGEEAIAFAEKYKPDIILMDIGLAGEIDGIEAARIIQAANPIPVIFITGYNEEDIKERVMQVKHAGFFFKPYPTEELKRLIISVCGSADDA